jgi:tetratricopeptide (TPR) repeat protein
MVPAPAVAYIDTIVTAQKLREIARGGRGANRHDRIAATMLHRSPTIHEADAHEVRCLLEELVAGTLARMREAGLDPEQHASTNRPRMSARERRNVSALAALLTYSSIAALHEGKRESARDCAKSALAWSCFADDHAQQAFAWMALAEAHQGIGEHGKEEEFTIEAVAAARRSEMPLVLAEALGAHASLLIVQMRLDEAEVITEEALALVTTWPDGDRERRVHATIMLNKARITLNRTQHAEGIRILRSVLEWVDPEVDPHSRATLLAHLGSVYLRLEQFRASIECQHEVVRLGTAMGSMTVTAWGYFRLAEAHIRLREFEQAEEMLDRADESHPPSSTGLTLIILAKRAQMYCEIERYDQALRLCDRVLESVSADHAPDLSMFVLALMATIETRKGRSAEAEGYLRRAIEVAEAQFPARLPTLTIQLATLIAESDRGDEALRMLDTIPPDSALAKVEQAAATRVRARVAESAGDLAGALRLEREAAGIEREFLEERFDQQLLNARIAAETDLLERDADAERQRRQRVERELAEVVVELGERNRLVERLEQRLVTAIQSAGGDGDATADKLLRETLEDLRTQSDGKDIAMRYIAASDAAFYRALRERFPGLTPKQERLCALIGLGLSPKQIEAAMGIGAEGLKAQRKRLRKRIGLAPTDRLEPVFVDLLADAGRR